MTNKKLLFIMILILLTSFASASNCGTSLIRNKDLEMIYSSNIYAQSMDIFDDGNYIINFEDKKLIGYNFITIIKEENEVRSVKSGVCEGNNNIKINVEFSLDDVNKVVKNRNIISGGYSLINDIKGISFFQKLRILKVLVLNKEELLVQ